MLAIDQEIDAAFAAGIDAVKALGLRWALHGQLSAGIALLGRALRDPAVRDQPQTAQIAQELGWRLATYGWLRESAAVAARLPPPMRLRLEAFLAQYDLAAPAQLAAKRKAAWDVLSLQDPTRPPQHRPIPTNRRIRLGHFGAAGLIAHEAFRAHEVALHDRARFQLVHYYHGGPPPSEIIADDLWVDYSTLDSAAFYDRVVADGIDILVDHCDLLKGRRVGALSLKPAPLQIARAAIASTGCPAMDYLQLHGDALSGPGLDPLSEQPVEIGQYLCWRPPPDAPLPPPRPVPPRGEPLLLGVFVQPPKLNPALARAWAAILNAVPDAKLVWKRWEFAAEAARERALAVLGAAGAPLDRIGFRAQSGTADHLAAYAEVDLALDSFPFAGHTTTAEALAMGAPVIGLIGDRMLCRINVSLTRAAGCGDLLADSAAAYIQRAVALASDRARLADYKQGLAERVRASALCDGPRWVRMLENAYQTMIARHNRRFV